MSLQLPRGVAAYFKADGEGGEAVARCFADEGVVKDERETHKGRAAIAAWKAAASAKYNYRSEPIAMAEQDGQVVVTGRVTGDFPGSPLDLRYFFTLDGDLIAALEIRP